MTTSGERSWRERGELLRQAFLLTGDRERAHRLAERAQSATALHIRRFGPAGSGDVARAELLGVFVAEAGPGGHAANPLPGSPYAAVWAALGSLPARRRAVIVLQYDEGLSEQQIALQMGAAPRTVRADAEAALLTLRTALNGAPDPGLLVSAALAEAGRRWAMRADEVREPVPAYAAGGQQPMGAQTAGHRTAGQQTAGQETMDTEAAGHRTAGAPHPTLAGRDPVGDRPNGADAPPFAAAVFPVDSPPMGRRRLRAPAALAAAAVTTLVLATVAVAVPALFGDPETGPAPAADAASASGSPTAVIQVPTRSVPKGLLDWPARGPQGEDEKMLSAATAAWRARARAAEAPASSVGLLYAGTVDGRQVALLQALDRSGTPRLAQVSGAAADSLQLVRAERLAGDTDVLTMLPGAGPAGPIRVLVSPEGQAADGLLASDVSAMPLKRIRLNDDGVSEILPSPPGAPTCSRVVVMGLPAPLGRTGPRVLQSGIVRADLLTAMSMEVEVGSSTLAGGDNATPETAWFSDGARLARKAGGGKVVVAALGPRLAPQAVSGTDRRIVQSRAYELRRGRDRLVGSVVTLGRTIICTTVSPVAPTQNPALAAFALRCPMPGGSGTMGLLHIVGAADVKSVQVNLDPTREPPGQQPYGSSVERPPSGPTSGFAVLEIIESGFPCGGGTVQGTGDAAAAAPLRLPVFTP